MSGCLHARFGVRLGVEVLHQCTVSESRRKECPANQRLALRTLEDVSKFAVSTEQCFLQRATNFALIALCFDVPPACRNISTSCCSPFILFSKNNERTTFISHIYIIQLLIRIIKLKDKGITLNKYSIFNCQVNCQVEELV